MLTLLSLALLQSPEAHAAGAANPAPVKLGLGMGVAASFGGTTVGNAVLNGSARVQVANAIGLEPRFGIVSDSASGSSVSTSETANTGAASTAWSLGMSLRPRLMGTTDRLVAVVGGDYLSVATASGLSSALDDGTTKIETSSNGTGSGSGGVINAGFGFEHDLSPKFTFSADLVADILLVGTSASATTTTVDEGDPATDTSGSTYTRWGFVPSVRFSLHFWP
jgi:hypothetical protein